jgi:hypothetical protein
MLFTSLIISALLSWNAYAHNLHEDTLEARTSSTKDRIQLVNNEMVNLGKLSYVHFLANKRQAFKGCQDAKLTIGLSEIHSPQRSHLVVMIKLKNQQSGKVESSEVGILSLGEKLELPLKAVAFTGLEIWSVSDRDGSLLPGWMQAEQPVLNIEYSSAFCEKSYRAEFSGEQGSMLISLTSLFAL